MVDSGPSLYCKTKTGELIPNRKNRINNFKRAEYIRANGHNLKLKMLAGKDKKCVLTNKIIRMLGYTCEKCSLCVTMQAAENCSRLTKCKKLKV